MWRKHEGKSEGEKQRYAGSVKNLHEPMWSTTTFGATLSVSPFCMRHSRCSVRSPPMPNASARKWPKWRSHTAGTPSHRVPKQSLPRSLPRHASVMLSPCVCRTCLLRKLSAQPPNVCEVAEARDAPGKGGREAHEAEAPRVRTCHGWLPSLPYRSAAGQPKAAMRRGHIRPVSRCPRQGFERVQCIMGLGRGNHHDPTQVGECRERAQGVTEATHGLSGSHKDQSCGAGLRLASAQGRVSRTTRKGSGRVDAGGGRDGVNAKDRESASEPNPWFAVRTAC